LDGIKSKYVVRCNGDICLENIYVGRTILKDMMSMKHIKNNYYECDENFAIDIITKIEEYFNKYSEKEIEEYYAENKKYPQNINEMFEQSLMLRSNTINNLHRFIFAVPKTNMMYDYTNKIIKRYMVLISRNTDKIYEYVQDNIKITGINTNTKFVSYNNTRPYDPSHTADYYT
jgi:hypothetical protein